MKQSFSNKFSTVSPNKYGIYQRNSAGKKLYNTKKIILIIHYLQIGESEWVYSIYFNFLVPGHEGQTFLMKEKNQINLTADDAIKAGRDDLLEVIKQMERSFSHVLTVKDYTDIEGAKEWLKLLPNGLTEGSKAIIEQVGKKVEQVGQLSMFGI